MRQGLSLEQHCCKSLISGSLPFLDSIYPEDGSSKLPRNVINILPVDTTSSQNCWILKDLSSFTFKAHRLTSLLKFLEAKETCLLLRVACGRRWCDKQGQLSKVNSCCG
jgi:hypothetical protein